MWLLQMYTNAASSGSVTPGRTPAAQAHASVLAGVDACGCKVRVCDVICSDGAVADVHRRRQIGLGDTWPRTAAQGHDLVMAGVDACGCKMRVCCCPVC